MTRGTVLDRALWLSARFCALPAAGTRRDLDVSARAKRSLSPPPSGSWSCWDWSPCPSLLLVGLQRHLNSRAQEFIGRVAERRPARTTRCRRCSERVDRAASCVRVWIRGNGRRRSVPIRVSRSAALRRARRREPRSSSSIWVPSLSGASFWCPLGWISTCSGTVVAGRVPLEPVGRVRVRRCRQAGLRPAWATGSSSSGSSP